jgi:RecA/RadA recombinase
MKITGHSKLTERLVTGLYSFDRAFINKDGEIGFPLGKMTEIWGATHIGKSTVTYSIAALIAHQLENNIVLADLEDFDPEFLIAVCSTNGFSGEVHSVLDDTDEKTLDTMLDALQESYCVGILDSVGAISPHGERKGSLGEANMGQRAKLMAQFSRRGIFILRSSDNPKSIFMINHQHPTIGGFGMGYKPPGGETKGYLSSIRISLKRLYIPKQGKRLYNKTSEQRFPEGSYCVHGIVKKNKWGLEGLEFNLFVLSGRGVHRGLTAVLDGFMLGKVTRSRSAIKIGDESYGSLPSLIEEAQAGNDTVFEPFFDVLKENEDD